MALHSAALRDFLRSQDVAQAVVVADLRVFVVGRGVASLGSQLAGVLDKLLVRRDQHTAAGGGDDLVAVEGEDARLAEDARRAVVVGRAQGLGRVLDQGHVVALAGLQDGVDVGRLAVEMYQHHCSRPDMWGGER
jgi:hypothetical protein